MSHFLVRHYHVLGVDIQAWMFVATAPRGWGVFRDQIVGPVRSSFTYSGYSAGMAKPPLRKPDGRVLSHR
jgi:hypothetical protein